MKTKTPPVLCLLVLFLSVVVLFFSEFARAQKGGDPIPPPEDELDDFEDDLRRDFGEVPPPVIDDDEDEDDSSLQWPPPMPETRHLKQYRVSQLKAFLDERGATCDACAEKYDWVNRVVDTWNWPRKETIKATDTSSKTTKNADDDDDDEDEMTPEEKRREDERLKRMMDELNGDKERDYSGMDPKKASLLKKLQSKGLSFMGGESMDVNQLEQLVKAMDGVKGRSGEDL
tara:strand:+ start:82 stop:771 length:690 start_codon:yes stop_codon:yes gene_type:complete